jgi:outer membrane protein OmpA-like peptidoglycan-associated protein
MSNFFSKTSTLAVGIAVAAVAYFWAKPAHNGAEAAKTAVTAPAPAAAPAAAAPAAEPAKAAAPDAQIFFAVGKASLPADSAKTLEAVIAKLKANPAAKATISGFNDANGDKAKNELLAKERAKSVREALRAAGVAGEADARIVMQKPDETMGSVDAEQARRVDITVQ